MSVKAVRMSGKAVFRLLRVDLCVFKKHGEAANATIIILSVLVDWIVGGSRLVYQTVYMASSVSVKK